MEIEEVKRKPYTSPLLGVVSIASRPVICQSPSGNPTDPEDDIFD